MRQYLQAACFPSLLSVRDLVALPARCSDFYNGSFHLEGLPLIGEDLVYMALWTE